MPGLLNKGLSATAVCWQPLQQVYGWIHQLAQVLDETQQMPLEERQLQFAVVLLSIQEHAASLGASFQQAIAHVCWRYGQLRSPSVFLLADP